MKAPSKEHQAKYNKKSVFKRNAMMPADNETSLRSLPVVPVVVDPVLSRHLRPHQKEGTHQHSSEHSIEVLIHLIGVQFMYECVMGLRKHEGQGCILADEMSVTIVCYLMLSTLPQLKGYGQDVAGGRVVNPYDASS